MMAGSHNTFWRLFPGLVWANPDADDSVHIRAALLRPRFDRLLRIAVEFGTERLKQEWGILLNEDTPEARRARESVTRILNNIQEGFSLAATRD